MESFVETKDRRVKKEKMAYKPKRGGQGSHQVKEEDIPMKIEAENEG